MAKIIDQITSDGVVSIKDDASDWRCCCYLFAPELENHLSQEQIDTAKANIEPEELARLEDLYTRIMLPRNPMDPLPI